jgi:DNA polymerase III sliding clamp (beta) subunit (PCNA family)
MRFTLPSSVLLNAVGQAAGVAAAKSPKRILECVALRATEKDGVVIEANDLDVSLRMVLPDARVAEPGVVVVPASRLVSVLREVGEGTNDITLVGADNRLDIDTEQCHFRIHGDDPAEFPAVPPFPAVALASVDGAVLRGMIDRTFATARRRRSRSRRTLKLAKGSSIVATDAAASRSRPRRAGLPPKPASSSAPSR